MVGRAGWSRVGWGGHDVEWIILVGGGAGERKEQGCDWFHMRRRRRRLAWDACAMNQLSKYGPCSSSQHTHPFPVQSGWASLLPVYLSLLLSHVYYSTLLTVMEESPWVNLSYIILHSMYFSQHINLYCKWQWHSQRQRYRQDPRLSWQGHAGHGWRQDSINPCSKIY